MYGGDSGWRCWPQAFGSRRQTGSPRGRGTGLHQAPDTLLRVPRGGGPGPARGTGGLAHAGADHSPAQAPGQRVTTSARRMQSATMRKTTRWRPRRRDTTMRAVVSPKPWMTARALHRRPVRPCGFGTRSRLDTSCRAQASDLLGIAPHRERAFPAVDHIAQHETCQAPSQLNLPLF